jgi:DNA-binding transcriptional MerR regulator
MEAGARGKTYKIGQAAKLLDVKPFVLRFWEGEFKDVLVPVRTPAGQRAYTEANVATVREIKRLLYDEGLTIEGAKKRLVSAQAEGAPLSPGAQAQHSAAPASAAPLPLLTVAEAAAPAPAPSATPAAPAAAPDAGPRATELADALADVARELKAIRDLLT